MCFANEQQLVEDHRRLKDELDAMRYRKRRHAEWVQLYNVLPTSRAAHELSYDAHSDSLPEVR